MVRPAPYEEAAASARDAMRLAFCISGRSDSLLAAGYDRHHLMSPPSGASANRGHDA